MRHVVVIILTMALVPMAAGQDKKEKKDKKLDKAEMERLVKLIDQLASKKYKERQVATKAIEGFGEPALATLEKAAKDATDLEQSRRLGHLIWRLRAPARAEQAKQIALLIPKLNSDRFEEREATAKKLTEFGQPALSQLYEATFSADVEMARRAQSIIDKILQ